MKSPGLLTNFVFNAIGSALPIMVALVTIPLYVHTIGAARYGVLSIVFILLGYFGFLDFGLSRASANALSKLHPDHDRFDRHRVILTSFYLNLGLGVLGSLAITLIGHWVVNRFLHLTSDVGTEFNAAFPYVACMLPLALVSGVGVGAMESRERFLASNILQTTGNALGQVLPVTCALVFGPSLAIIIPAALAARLLTVAAIALYVVRTEQIRHFRVFDRARSRALFSYGAWVSVTNLLSPLLESLDQLMIGSILGVAAVTYYAVPMSLATRSQIVASALARTLFPRLSRLDAASATALAQHSVVALAYGFGAICAPAILLALPFLQVWMGASFAERSSAVAELLMIGAWFNGIAFIPFILLQGQGRPDLGAKAHAAEIIPFIGILWGLTHSFGLAGAALAWSMRTTADALVIFLLAGCRAGYLLRLVPALLLVLVAYGLTWLAPPSLAWALLRAALASAAILGCGLLVEPSLRHFVTERFQRFLRPGMLNAEVAALHETGMTIPAIKHPASISIAMATYNGGAFLRTQLDSLAAQTLLPAELVISDDNSNDDTRTVVASFAATAPFPVRFHVNPTRLGFRGNFHRAASLCSGELVAYSDQDDIWHPSKLATVSALFHKDPGILLVHHNANVLRSDGKCIGFLAPPGRHPQSFEPLTAHPWLVSHGFTQTFRRELLSFQDLWEQSLDATVSDERMSHDQWQLFFASVFGKIAWIDAPLADYRQHDRNTYGWFEESLGRRFRLWLEDRSSVYARCRDAAERRADILDIASLRVEDPHWRARAKTASARYRTLASLYDTRVKVYGASSVFRRLGALRALYNANAYNRRGDWTFHAKGACKDIALGVLAGPVLRRYGYLPAWGDPSCGAVAHG